MKRRTKKKKSQHRRAVRSPSTYCLPRHKLRAKLRAALGDLDALRNHHAETECKVERQASKILALQTELAELRAKLAPPKVDVVPKDGTGEPQLGGAA